MRPSPHLLSVSAGLLLTVSACSGSPTQSEDTQQQQDGATAAAPSPDDVRDVLQRYFDANHECSPFFTMPIDTRLEPGADRVKQLEAFAAAGLLQRSADQTRQHEVTGSPEHYVSFTVTPQGQQWIKSGESHPLGTNTMICYGRRKIESAKAGAIDEMSPDRVSVSYTYRLIDVPDWTRASAIQQRYPGLAKRLDGPQAEAFEQLSKVNGAWTLSKQTSFGSFDFRQDSH